MKPLNQILTEKEAEQPCRGITQPNILKAVAEWLEQYLDKYEEKEWDEPKSYDECLNELLRELRKNE